MNNRVFMDFVAGNTALGRIEIELFFDITPQTCENFRGLCTGEYGEGHVYRKKLTYKGTKIFQVVDGKYMIGGDIVYNSGRGGESIYGEFFKDENFKRRHACGGLLSMNNFGKDKNNSQFIITIKACPQLDDKHVVFGHVIKGMEVIKEIGKIPTDMNNRPKIKIFVFNCGDYDFKRTKFQGDIFKETIDEIIKIRTEKEKIKIMGPEEIKEYKKQLEEKKAEEEKKENDYNFQKENDDDKNLDIRGNNLIDNLIINNNNKNTLKNNIDIYNEEEEEDEEDDNDDPNVSKQNKVLDEDIMKEYESTLLKINEAINLNNKEVNLSNYINSNHGLINQDNNYIFLNGKRADKNWAKREEETKNILMAKGIPETKQYLLESINQNERRENYLNKKKKREIHGNDLFTTEAYYRAYKKRSKVLPFDKDLYDDEMKNGINKNKIQNEIKKELLGNDMKQQIEKRSKFSRRRPIIEEDEVNYINERNQKYNKKLYRFFGNESKEIKNNMERRTAL